MTRTLIDQVGAVYNNKQKIEKLENQVENLSRLCDFLTETLIYMLEDLKILKEDKVEEENRV